MAVYLLHFERPYKHARHYIGFAEDANLTRRIDHHRAGQGARLLQVVNQAGISYELVRVWKGASRHFERRVKNCKKTSQFCPVCNPDHAMNRMLTENMDKKE